MTTGNVLYLIMCLASFGVFSAVLAYVSWPQSRLDQATTREPAQTAELHPPIAA